MRISRENHRTHLCHNTFISNAFHTTKPYEYYKYSIELHKRWKENQPKIEQQPKCI